MPSRSSVSRRDFISRGVKTAAGVAAVNAVVNRKVLGANDRINIAVVGVHSRGKNHIEEWLKIPGVEITWLVDPDARLFAERVKMVKEGQDSAPKTTTDLRVALEDKNLTAISTASPDHWHALQAIWACQAGKHVYAEKPLSHNIWEGRQMVKAARRYNRVVQCGMQNRSILGVRKAMEFLRSGGLGEIYMAKGLCFKPRDSIGVKANAPVPEGLDWDIWLGPAAWRPYNPQFVHYNWHWFWDFGCTDLGNQGPHQMDIARWGLNKNVYPVKVKCAGDYFAYKSDQETPNTQMALFEYEDNKILQFEVRGLYTNAEDGIKIGNLFYGTEGWMHLNGDKWFTYLGRTNEPGPKYEGAGVEADPNDLAGAGSSAHFVNFIDAVRAEDYQQLNGDVLEGHRSTALCHLANISNRLGRELKFDSHRERFIDDEVANGYLYRDYRHPYVVPKEV